MSLFLLPGCKTVLQKCNFFDYLFLFFFDNQKTVKKGMSIVIASKKQ